MIGIIWCKSINKGIKELEDIIRDYKTMGIDCEYKTKSKYDIYCIFSNNDIWRVELPNEKIFGLKCNVSYIEYGMDKDVLDRIILPATIMPPFTGTHYFK